MQVRTSIGDGLRLSVSSTYSTTSSQGSGVDDLESPGDVYVWGEVWSDGGDITGSLPSSAAAPKIDLLVPKLLESNLVLDVDQIACGVRHMALITRQGEIFTWGEEGGGRLGHGNDRDVCRPRLVERLAQCNISSAACGEYHTAAVSRSGEVFTWGDGTYCAGLLGHGTVMSHWLPKRISGPLEGVQVQSVACGSWHSAITSSNGKLFTFGDGTFGALGHGNRETILHPKEVQVPGGLMVTTIACGLYHTACIMKPVNTSSSRTMFTGKLFTWGDGDKNKLGHGDKKTCLVPTCVSALAEYNFSQIGCGNEMTVALTITGHVFTMGSTAFGQLGSSQADGKLPSLVQDKLVGEFVEAISCGAYHVMVMTNRNEVFSWGRGANGRLGHGDTDDRKSPTLIESLKDKNVKTIFCGSSFTVSICSNKGVSGADQSLCSGCRQMFGFTRKRHNCYNCGLGHCRACSTKKVMGAALAPTPGKPHHVCDTCYSKLRSAAESNFHRRKAAAMAAAAAASGGGDVAEGRKVGRSSMLLLPLTVEPINSLDIQSIKPGDKSDLLSTIRVPQVQSFLQLKDMPFPSSLSAIQNVLKAPPIPPQPPVPSPQVTGNRPVPRRQSPPRSATPVFCMSAVDVLKKTKEQEVSKLQGEIKALHERCDARDEELERLQKKSEASLGTTHDQCSSCVVLKEVIGLVKQLKSTSEKLPSDMSEVEVMKAGLREVEHSLNTIVSSGKINFVPQTSKVEQSQEGRENYKAKPSSIDASSDSKELIEPGVYALIHLRGGVKIFDGVKFSKKRFDPHHAEEWWKRNKDRVMMKYSQPIQIESTSTSNPIL